jgi:hypothetical protein
MGAQIPLIAEKLLSACGFKKFQLDALGDHLCTCTVHSGAKKAHDWAVDQIADLFRTIHKEKTKKVVRSRGHQCGDIELVGYLANAAGPVPGVVSLELNGTPQGARVMLRWHALGFEEVTIEKVTLPSPPKTRTPEKYVIRLQRLLGSLFQFPETKLKALRRQKALQQKMTPLKIALRM